MPSSADGGRAWIALAGLLGLGAALAFQIDPNSLDWQPGRIVAEPWRAVSAAFVHYSALHLAANLAGLALVAALGWFAHVPRPIAAAWLIAWPLTQLGLLARPDLLHYGGLSGILHAGVACVAWQLILHERGRRRAIGALTLALIAIKVVSEAPWGPALRHPAGWDIATAPFAHASGLVAGLFAAALSEAVMRRRRGGAALDPAPSPSIVAMSERKPHLDTLAVVSLVLCCFLWGLNQVAAKAALPEVPALWQAGLRSSGAALLVWLWARARGIALFERDRTLPGGLIAGALFAAEFFCIFIGLQFTTASRMVVFIYISPFVVALGMPLIARSERLRPLQSAGLVLAFAGVAWAFAEGFSRPAAGPLQWLGDGLGVLAGILWGATTLAIRASTLEPRIGGEDPALPTRRVGRAAARRRLRKRAAVAAASLAAGLEFARVPDRHRQLCQLPALVLADPPLSGDAAGLVHDADAGVRPGTRRRAAWPSR